MLEPCKVGIVVLGSERGGRRLIPTISEHQTLTDDISHFSLHSCIWWRSQRHKHIVADKFSRHDRQSARIQPLSKGPGIEHATDRKEPRQGRQRWMWIGVSLCLLACFFAFGSGITCGWALIDKGGTRPACCGVRGSSQV